MERIFIILSIVGVVYLAFTIFLTGGKKETNDLLRKQLTMQNIRHRLQSEKLQILLKDAGVSTLSGNVNLIRFGVAGLYLAVQLTVGYLRKQPFDPTDFLIPIGIVAVTSSEKFAPLGMILRKMHKNRASKKDGELISFLRLYENNRMKKRGHTEFSAYCAQVASYYQYIRHDLYELSERAVDEGIENAVEWFCSQFPEDHPFISDFRSIILATESMSNDEEAIEYLNMQSKIISKISADSYERKWSNIGTISTFFTVTPSVATFLDIVCLALMYVMLIKSQFNGVGLY